EPGLARTVGQSRDAAGVAIATTVENNLADARGLGALPEKGTHLARDIALRALGGTQRGVHRGGRHQGVALRVVHDLRGDLPQAAGDHQARPLGRTADVLADPEVAARLADGALGGDATAALEELGAHFLP